MYMNLRLNQAKLPQLLPTRLAQTRALKQYKVKNTKYTTYQPSKHGSH